jgi:hypothetical protein
MPQFVFVFFAIRSLLTELAVMLFVVVLQIGRTYGAHASDWFCKWFTGTMLFMMSSAVGTGLFVASENANGAD